MSTRSRWAAGALAAVTLGEAALIHLGRTYGSTERERAEALPGDRIVSDPNVVTDHAIRSMPLHRPSGPPHTQCGLTVEEIEPERALVMHSNSHLPMSWRAHATLDWSWAFVLTPLDQGRRTRFHFRSRWTTCPEWLTLSGREAQRTRPRPYAARCQLTP
jgi:hypothetical protein